MKKDKNNFDDLDHISSCEDEFVDESYKDEDELIEESCCTCEHEHKNHNHEHACKHTDNSCKDAHCSCHNHEHTCSCDEDDDECEDDFCDLDASKICDNCGKCLEEYMLPQDEKGFYNFEAKFDKSGMSLEELYKAYGLTDDTSDE